MIFPLLGFLLGGALGAVGARRRGGARLDLLQWAAVGAIIGGLLGLFALIAVERSLVA